ncbi:MAG TPA: hypothetical protein VF068_04690 [Rubrobacter sp.]
MPAGDVRARLDISVTLALAATVHFWERRDLPAVFLAGFLAFTPYHAALNYGEITVCARSVRVLIVNTIGGRR